MSNGRSSEQIRLNEHEREVIVGAVVSRLQARYFGQGIRVLRSGEVAKRIGKTKRHLPRLERVGEIPRRRRIGKRCIGYLAHELEDLPAGSVIVRDRRTVGRRQLAGKLGMNERTVSRMVRRGEMPPPVRGRWLERDIDVWLLSCPLV